MTEKATPEDGKQPEKKKKVELSFSQHLQNIAFGMGTPIYMALTVWWYVNLCWHTRRKHNRFAGAPVTIQLFGSDPEQALDILKSYNVRYAYGSIQWAVLDNKIGLLMFFMVSKASFDYADGILAMYEGVYFSILSNEGTKRGQNMGQPHAHRGSAKRQPSKPQNKPKLGKTYGSKRP
jgi:hypothetical protein